jgi:hypothetical protein
MPTDLNTHVANFQSWLKTDQGDAATWQKERDERLAWYRSRLTKNGIEKLSREDFSTLVKSLWAVNIWHNKDYKVSRLIHDNGLEKLRVSLSELFHGSGPVDKRWDAFRAAVKGFGPSSLSEILAFHDPQTYALVNLKPYRVLPRLGVSISPVSDGKSYKKATEEIAKVKQLLQANGLTEADFVFTDFFIAYLFYHVFHLQFARKEQEAVPVAPEKAAPEIAEPELPERGLTIGTHEAAEAMLLKLGNLLGYDTYTPDAGKTCNGEKLGDLATLEELPEFTSPKIMESVERIDVVWLKEEWPECFFEVEHTTGVTSGLLRIYQVEKLPAKFFIIGPEGVLKRYEREVEKAPFSRIKSKYRFRSYDVLRKMYDAASAFRKVSDYFLGE